jgi:hypothetical protein
MYSLYFLTSHDSYQRTGIPFIDIPPHTMMEVMTLFQELVLESHGVPMLVEAALGRSSVVVGTYLVSAVLIRIVPVSLTTTLTMANKASMKHLIG